MNRFLLAVLWLCLSHCAYAQQIPLFTQYREAQGVLNPASINYDFFTDRHKTSFGMTFRRQWTDITNAPTTQILRGEHFAADRNGVGLLYGGYLMNDQTGPTGYTGLYGRFATVFSNDLDYSGLSIGLSAGGVQYRLKASELKLHDPNDIRALTDRAQLYPDIGMGVFFYKRMEGVFDEDYFYAGASVPQLMGLDIEFAAEAKTITTKRIQHYFGNIGWYHFTGNGSYVEPSIWVKYTPNAKVNVDVNCRYQFGSTMWLGVGSSLQGKIHAETGVLIGKSMGFDTNFKIGYGFDYSYQSYGPYVGATHEVNVSFAF